ncbi:MAG: TIR domain-containing protein [bacterium]|nr:TIR domain-containing protein [bacterium]
MANLENDVFISYSRTDKEFARALERALEAFRPPKGLGIPKRRLVAFRDEQDFTGVDYFESLQHHLEQSAKLIVVCSPAARRSQYVDDEIRRFAELHGHENVIPVLLSGMPNNETSPGQEERAAFPNALVETMAMPLASSYVGFEARKDGINKGRFQDSWYTILANIHDVSRREIEDRDRKRQARERRGRRAIVAGVAVMVGGFAWYYDSYVRLHIALYNQFEVRTGEPTPIGALERSTVEARETSFRVTRQGRRGWIHRVESVNNSGVCTPPRKHVFLLVLDPRLSAAAYPCRWDFDRDASGRVTSQRAYDRVGRLTWTQAFTGAGDGNVVRAQYVRPDGTPFKLLGSKAEFIEMRTSDSLGEVEIRYLSGDSEPVPVPEEQGLYGKRLRVDPGGSVVEEVYLGPNGERAADAAGVSRVTFKRDALGNSTERRYFDNEDRPTIGVGGYHSASSRYDHYGNLLERAFFEAEGQPVALADGYHRVLGLRDHRGRLTGWSYFDGQNAPTLAADGAHRVTLAFDDLGNRTATTYFGTSGEPIRIWAGYHREESDYDQEGNRVTWRYFDSSGEPTSSAKGYHRGTTRFDADGRRTEVAYFDGRGNPVLGQDGYHRLKLVYDLRGKVISVERLDASGTPVRSLGRIEKLLLERPPQGDVQNQLIWLVDLINACKETKDPTLIAQANLMEVVTVTVYSIPNCRYVEGWLASLASLFPACRTT